MCLTVPQRHTVDSTWIGKEAAVTIREVCERTGLTKKAVRHYESLGLIAPEVLSNGYREFGEGELARLIEINVLSQLGFSLDEIGQMRESPSSTDARIRERIEELKTERERLNASTALLEELSSTELSLSDLRAHHRELLDSLQDKPGFLVRRLKELFPGGLGEVLGLAYGHLLDARLLTDDAMDAWRSLIQELDDVDPIEIPDPILQWTQRAGDPDAIRARLDAYKNEYSQDYESFASTKLSAVDSYLDSTPEDEQRAAVERAQMIASFFAGPAAPIARIMQSYLPRLSESYGRILEHQARLLRENPQLQDQLGINQIKS